MLRSSLLAALAATTMLTPSGAAAQTILHTVTWGGSTYDILAPTRWSDAEVFAQSLGGHLTSIHSLAENDFLTDWVSGTLGDTPVFRSFWIGLHLTGGAWSWSDGSAVSWSNWRDGEPNGDGQQVEISWVTGYEGGWNDWGGADQEELHAVIERSAVEGTVAPEPITMILLGSGLAGVGAARRRRAATRFG